MSRIMIGFLKFVKVLFEGAVVSSTVVIPAALVHYGYDLTLPAVGIIEIPLALSSVIIIYNYMRKTEI